MASQNKDCITLCLQLDVVSHVTTVSWIGRRQKYGVLLQGGVLTESRAWSSLLLPSSYLLECRLNDWCLSNHIRPGSGNQVLMMLEWWGKGNLSSWWLESCQAAGTAYLQKLLPWEGHKFGFSFVHVNLLLAHSTSEAFCILCTYLCCMTFTILNYVSLQE